MTKKKNIKKKILSYSRNIVSLCTNLFNTVNQNLEHFGVIFLNDNLEFLGFKFLISGTENKVGFYVEDIFRQVILFKSNNVIFIHNHPSGDCYPSKDDLSTFSNLYSYGDLININVIDNIIIAKGNSTFYSYLLKDIALLWK